MTTYIPRRRRIEARRFIDGVAHLYYSSEFAAPLMGLVTPLHSDASWYPDDHEAHKVGNPLRDLSGVELCRSCAAVAWRLGLFTPSVVPSPRPRRYPDRDDRATPAGAVPTAPLAPAGVSF